MKAIHLFKTRGLILILGAVLGVGVGFTAPAVARGVIVDPDGKVTYIVSSTAVAINDAGQVVGQLNAEGGSNHAFITGPEGKGVSDLGTLGGNYSASSAINESGQVVGYSRMRELDPFGYTVNHAFITGPNGKGMTDLGTLGGNYSSASDINDSGQVVGESEPTKSFYGPRHAFITGPNGKGMTDLGSLDGAGNSVASGINNSGQVVGQSSGRAFITGPNGVGMTYLGTFSGRAIDINDSGQVVGWSETADGFTHAFITGPDGMGMTDLGTLGGSDSFAYGINDSGQVVGTSETVEGTRHAFITGPNGEGVIDINSYADLPDGVYLGSASINNLGQVASTVYTIPPPISPIPEPASYALMLAGLGLAGFMARRKKPTGNTAARC